MSASISALYDGGYIEALAVPQLGTFEAAMTFARSEGIIPAPESAHAIKAAVDEALEAKELGEERVIVFNLSGHGYFDLAAYEDYLGGKLQNFEYPQKAIEDALAKLPEVSV